MFKPSQFQAKMLGSKLLLLLSKTFSSNHNNYFIAYSNSIIYKLGQNFNTMEASNRPFILEILQFAMTSIGHFPVKEMVLLLPFIESLNTNSKTLSNQILSMINSVLIKSPKTFFIAFREIGLLDALNSVISTHLNPRENNTIPAESYKANFQMVLETILHLMEDNENASLFRKITGGGIFEVLKDANHQLLAVEIVKHMVRESIQGGYKHLNDFLRLLEMLQSTQRSNFSLKIVLMTIIKDLMINSLIVRISFRENGGMIALISILLGLESVFVVDNPSNCDFTEHIHLIELIFGILISSIKSNDESYIFFTEHVGIKNLVDALRLTGILNTQWCGIAFGGLFGLAILDQKALEIFKPKLNKTIYLPDSSVIIVNGRFILEAMNLLPETLPAYIDIQNQVLHAVNVLIRANKNNQITVNQSGLLGVLIIWLFDENQPCWIHASEVPSAIQHQMDTVLELASIIIKAGVSDIELRSLMTMFNITQTPNSSEARHIKLFKLIHDGLKSGISPDYIQMDLSSSQHSCIWIEDFGKPFPPSNGYTFNSWIRVKKFDSMNIIPILGFSK